MISSSLSLVPIYASLIETLIYKPSRTLTHPHTPSPPLHTLTHPHTPFQVFYESANGVLLSDGFEGVIPPRFFTGAEDRNGRPLELAEADHARDAPAVDGVGVGSATWGRERQTR